MHFCKYQRLLLNQLNNEPYVRLKKKRNKNIYVVKNGKTEINHSKWSSIIGNQINTYLGNGKILQHQIMI